MNKYKNNLLHIILEEYAGFLTRSLPSMEGILIRRFVYRALCRKFGSGVLIYAGVHLTHTYGLEIGDNFSVNTGAVIDARGGIRIGNSVMVGPHSVLVSSSHQFKDVSEPMSSLDHIMQPLVIEDDVWIGANTFIKGGITIGRGVVVGAGSVVLKDIPDYQIVGGAAGASTRVIGDRRDIGKTFEG